MTARNKRGVVVGGSTWQQVDAFKASGSVAELTLTVDTGAVAPAPTDDSKGDDMDAGKVTVETVGARVPMPGDVVRLVGVSGWGDEVKVGSIGVIGGILGQSQAEYDICWHPHTFRGASSRNGPEYVSVSGGPCAYLPAAWLTPTNETVAVSVWRWADNWPSANGGVSYTVTVAVWEWDGQGRAAHRDEQA